MARQGARLILVSFGLLCLLALLPDAVTVWIDPTGHTYLTDRAEPPAPGARALAPEELTLGWGGQVTGEPLEPQPGTSVAESRLRRELLAARDDVRRGEVQRGLAELRRLHEEHPGRLEVALLLARVEQRRGRLLPAKEALATTLSIAGPGSEGLRDAAQTLLAELEEEIAFSEAKGTHGEMKPFEAGHFKIVYDDHSFGGRQYGERVLELLEEARERAEQRLGRALNNPLEVRLYTRAHYLEAYEHRFGFATVGFYDGAIHVVAARRPREELFALLLHEYSHALFADALGGHQPFFLNEGIADGEEEWARGRPRLSRGEWRQLLDALREEKWIPLATLVEGFGAVQGKQALLAYLESRAAIELIESERPGALARWLDLCARGVAWERALEAETGWDAGELEHALMEAVKERFPEDPLARLQMK